MPKGVMQTHGMLCANQRMMELIQPLDPNDPPVLLDWLPWSHTFAGNSIFNSCIQRGGLLHIDTGRPLPGLFEPTIKNLREVSPTSYTNVPAGFSMLLSYLERDDELRRAFFARLDFMTYAGASLSQDVWQRYQDLAEQTTGERIAFLAGWGATEAPVITMLHWAVEGSGILGLPLPGVEVKMVPTGDKFELRVRGPHVTQGYFKRPDLTPAAFDEEAFYRIADAGQFVDADNPT